MNLRVKEAAEKYFDGDQEKKAVAVISGEEKLKAANDILSANPLKLKRI